MSEFNPLKDIKEFHEKFELEYDGKPRILEPELGQFRIRFLQEELEEYVEAVNNAYANIVHQAMFGSGEVAPNMELMLDALIDLAYVLFGAVYLHGLHEQFAEGWRRVHSANMKKERAPSADASKRGSKYDVIKPAGWKAPSLLDLVKDNVHD